MEILRECNRCGLRAYNRRELITYFPKDKYAKTGFKGRCKKCHSKESVVKDKRVKEVNKQNIKKYLGGSYKCNDCGFEHEYLGIFDWHHLDPSTKEFQLSKILHHSWKKYLKEIEKCVFLCANCHRLRHRL